MVLAASTASASSRCVDESVHPPISAHTCIHLSLSICRSVCAGTDVDAETRESRCDSDARTARWIANPLRQSPRGPTRNHLMNEAVDRIIIYRCMRIYIWVIIYRCMRIMRISHRDAYADTHRMLSCGRIQHTDLARAVRLISIAISMCMRAYAYADAGYPPYPRVWI